jgi:hypothetical protein
MLLSSLLLLVASLLLLQRAYCVDIVRIINTVQDERIAFVHFFGTDYCTIFHHVRTRTYLGFNFQIQSEAKPPQKSKFFKIMVNKKPMIVVVVVPDVQTTKTPAPQVVLDNESVCMFQCYD